MSCCGQEAFWKIHFDWKSDRPDERQDLDEAELLASLAAYQKTTGNAEGKENAEDKEDEEKGGAAGAEPSADGGDVVVAVRGAAAAAAAAQPRPAQRSAEAVVTETAVEESPVDDGVCTLPFEEPEEVFDEPEDDVVPEDGGEAAAEATQPGPSDQASKEEASDDNDARDAEAQEGEEDVEEEEEDKSQPAQERSQSQADGRRHPGRKSCPAKLHSPASPRTRKHRAPTQKYDPEKEAKRPQLMTGFREKGDPKNWVGKECMRFFGGEHWRARVLKWCPADKLSKPEVPRLWKVKHIEDGDMEELEEHEMVEAIQLWEEEQAKQINAPVDDDDDDDDGAAESTEATGAAAAAAAVPVVDENAPVLLELFSGSCTVSKRAKEYFDGNVHRVTVDIDKKLDFRDDPDFREEADWHFAADLSHVDAARWVPSLLTGIKKKWGATEVAMVWASPPCNDYSTANPRVLHCEKDYSSADNLVAKTQQIIAELQRHANARGKALRWIIENPATGELKSRPIMNGLLPWMDV